MYIYSQQVQHISCFYGNFVQHFNFFELLLRDVHFDFHVNNWKPVHTTRPDHKLQLLNFSLFFKKDFHVLKCDWYEHVGRMNDDKTVKHHKAYNL